MNDTEETTKAMALAISKFSDIINKLAGPLAEEVGMMLGDKVKYYRAKNWIKTVQKTERLLQDAGLHPKAVPPRLFLPIADASSLEDNETLQDMWAGLLATASQDTDAISPSFVETLKQLTPDEARALRQMHANDLRDPPPRYPESSLTWGLPESMSLDTHERLGLIRREYELTQLGPEDRQNLDRIAYRELDYEYELTDYALNFLRACQGPRGADESRSDETSQTDAHR